MSLGTSNELLIVEEKDQTVVLTMNRPQGIEQP